jgi:hypothetical protein
VSRYDLRWAGRHPLRWSRHWWLHLIVAATLAILAAAWDQPVFDQTFAPNLWPLAATFVAGLVLASALAPFERRLQATCGAALITLGLARVAAMAEVFYAGHSDRAVIVALGSHAVLIAVLGVIWPTWSAACGAAATVEAGNDDRGGRGAP